MIVNLFFQIDKIRKEIRVSQIRFQLIVFGQSFSISNKEIKKNKYLTPRTVLIGLHGFFKIESRKIISNNMKTLMALKRIKETNCDYENK